MKLIFFILLFISCSKDRETPLARVGSSVLYEKDLINEQGDKIKGYGFLICAVMCIAGSLRYPIARFYDKFKTKLIKNEKK